MYFKTTLDGGHHISDPAFTEGIDTPINNVEYETLKGLAWINYCNTTPYGDKYEFGDLTGLGKIVFEKIINKGE